MKKKWIFILAVLMIAATMFVACNSEVTDARASAQPGEELVYATFGGGSKALSVDYDFIDYTQSYWFYQAEKKDAYGTRGAVTGDNNWAKVPGDANRKGLDGTVGPFSQGLWAFKLRGYETEYDENPGEGNYDVSVEIGGHTYYYSGLVYSGESTGTGEYHNEVNLKYGNSNAIPVTVAPAGETGKIALGTLTDPLTYSWFSGGADGALMLKVTVSHPVSNSPMESWDIYYDFGTTTHEYSGYIYTDGSEPSTDLPTGNYNLEFTVCAVDNNNVAYEFAKQSLSLTVFGSQTTTVKGSLVEGLFVENAHFVATEVEVTIGTEKKTMSLVEFAKKVNDGVEGYATATAKLLEDVDLTDVAWTPIGTEENPFCGTFDGKNHTIIGLTIIESSTDTVENIGFFGCVSGDTTIKNVDFTDVNINHNGGKNLGTIVGLVKDETGASLTISGVTVSGTVYGGQSHISGFVGKKRGSGALTIINSTNNADVSSGSDRAAGFVATFDKEAALTMTNCTNNGDISAQSSVGGLIAYCVHAVSPIFTDCHNTGDISCTSTSTGNGTGGLIGYLEALYTYPVFENCSNSGNITCNDGAVGGLFGGMANNGGTQVKGVDLRGTISNTGTITGLKAGGIFGSGACEDSSATVGCYRGLVVTPTTIIQSEGNVVTTDSDSGWAAKYWAYQTSKKSICQEWAIMILQVGSQADISLTKYEDDHGAHTSAVGWCSANSFPIESVAICANTEDNRTVEAVAVGHTHAGSRAWEAGTTSEVYIIVIE